MEHTTPLALLDRASLTGPVRHALGRDRLAITEWHGEALTGGADLYSGGVFRVWGTARDGWETLPWSLVLKAARASTETGDSAHPAYWQREALAFQSGLLTDLPGGLSAPRCWGVLDRAPGAAWLWLEDLADPAETPWSLPHYRLAAAYLGRLNGAYLAGRRLPAAPWLSPGWLRRCVELAAPAVAQLARILGSPRVRQVYPPATAARLLRLWAEREALLAALEGLPQVWCHNDAFRRNLFLRGAGGSEPLLAIDWAYTGIGAVGAELGPFIQAPLAFFEVEMADAEALEEQAMAGYLEGLRAAGWRGDPGLVRFGYAASAALRYGLGELNFGLLLCLDDHRRTWLERAFGQPHEAIAERLGACVQVLLDWGDQARAWLASR